MPLYIALLLEGSSTVGTLVFFVSASRDVRVEGVLNHVSGSAGQARKLFCLLLHSETARTTCTIVKTVTPTIRFADTDIGYVLVPQTDHHFRSRRIRE
jgi:hypothetical protein